MLGHVESVFRNAGLRYDILINDVQQAVNAENPPLSPDVQEELEGRKGSCELFAEFDEITFDSYTSL